MYLAVPVRAAIADWEKNRKILVSGRVLRKGWWWQQEWRWQWWWWLKDSLGRLKDGLGRLEDGPADSKMV